MLLENWTIKELAIFEAGICTFGKRFDMIANMVCLSGWEEGPEGSVATLQYLEDDNEVQDLEVSQKAIVEVKGFLVALSNYYRYEIYEMIKD